MVGTAALGIQGPGARQLHSHVWTGPNGSRQDGGCTPTKVRYNIKIDFFVTFYLPALLNLPCTSNNE